MLYSELRMQIPQGPRYETIAIHGKQYLYYRKESKRINGKLKHSRMSLGRTISEDGEVLLIPNENYFSHMGMIQPKGEKVKKQGKQCKKTQEIAYADMPENGRLGFGYAIACHQLSRELGLWDALVEVFGDSMGRDILAIAAYMAKGSLMGMSGLEYFVKKQMLFTDTILSSQKLSNIYQSITSSNRADFFKLWVKRHGKDSSVCYDVTSISSYSKNIPIVAYGYNRDKEPLAQINLGMFCSMNDGLPLCYSEYNGNINDFTNFPYVMKTASEYGINNNFLVVMDGGFAIEQNIDFTSLQGYDFLMGAPINFCKDIRQLLLEWRENASTIEGTINYNYEPYRASEIYHVFGETEVRVLMYKSITRSSDDECTLVRHTHTMTESLEQLQGKMTVTKSKQYKDLFDITLKENGTFEYSLNEVAYRESQELCGCFALLCTRENLSLQDALKVYREKDDVEKSFGMLKNDILNERLHVAQLESLQGKIFLAFLGLILRRAFSTKLSQWVRQKRISLNVALEMLCDIECRKSKLSWVLTKAFTAQQKALIKLLDLPVNYLLEGDTIQ